MTAVLNSTFSNGMQNALNWSNVLSPVFLDFSCIFHAHPLSWFSVSHLQWFNFSSCQLARCQLGNKWWWTSHTHGHTDEHTRQHKTVKWDKHSHWAWRKWHHFPEYSGIKRRHNYGVTFLHTQRRISKEECPPHGCQPMGLVHAPIVLDAEHRARK